MATEPTFTTVAVSPGLRIYLITAMIRSNNWGKTGHNMAQGSFHSCSRLATEMPGLPCGRNSRTTCAPLRPVFIREPGAQAGVPPAKQRTHNRLTADGLASQMILSQYGAGGQNQRKTTEGRPVVYSSQPLSESPEKTDPRRAISPKRSLTHTHTSPLLTCPPMARLSDLPTPAA